MPTVQLLIPDQVFVARLVAALALDISLPTLDRLIRAKRLQTARVGRRVLVLRSSLEKLAEAKSG